MIGIAGLTFDVAVGRERSGYAATEAPDVSGTPFNPWVSITKANRSAIHAIDVHMPRMSYGSVEHSLQYLRPEDVGALVAYLRTTSPQTGGKAFNIAPAPVASSNASEPGRQPPQDELGRHIFAGGCANCHKYDGDGRQTVYPSLTGRRSASDPVGANVTEVTLNGAKYHIKDQTLFMPSFGAAHSDEKLAVVANYVIEHFGGKTGHVSPQYIAKERQE